jgi:hypothetical protein
MKLIIEKHPELTRLTNCFQKIEALAETMGVEIDDLVEDQKNSSVLYSHFKRKFLSRSVKRAELFKRSNSNFENKTYPLTVFFNRENK